jgi:hypothetical protein
MLIGYWYPPALETGGICQRTPQVHPCRLCASIHAGKTFAEYPPRFPRPLPRRLLKAKLLKQLIVIFKSREDFVTSSVTIC